MPPYTDDLRIRSFTELSTPAEVLRELVGQVDLFVDTAHHELNGG